MSSRILLTGATGFVGGHLYPALVDAGHDVVCATRAPERAAQKHPGREWVEVDLHKPETVEAALAGVDVAYYLVHAMAEGAGYAERELRAARQFVQIAARTGVGRIVYLGGVAPAGKMSDHLRSRLETGEVLRSGEVPCVELRAGMIIGAGSASWKICRDLAVRLPFMLLPRWLESRSRPVSIRDVVAALCAAADLTLSGSAVYELSGPEILSGKDILMRIASLRGTAPVTLNVPVLTPKLSSYWLKLVSGADFSIARELVEGLTSDLLPTGPTIWEQLPEHALQSFDDAALAALAAEGPGALRSRLLERLTRRISRSAVR